MTKADKNKNDDNKDKKAGDVLRARDIIPPFGSNLSDEPSKTAGEDSDIPTFDLAEQIMAEQRKLTARTRKSPSQKIEPLRPIPYNNMKASPIKTTENLLQEQIITDIVKRDIENLCMTD